MQILKKPDDYDQLQLGFAKELAARIKETVEDREEDDSNRGFSDSLAFAIAAAIDRSSDIEHEGVKVFPELTFRTSGKARADYIVSGQGSWMHEYIGGFVDELFDRDSEDSEEEDDNDGFFDSVCVRFKSGVKANLLLTLKNANLTKITEELLDALQRMIGDDPGLKPKQVVSEICQAFRQIDYVEFAHVDEHLGNLKEPNLSKLTIRALAKRILEFSKSLD